MSKFDWSGALFVALTVVGSLAAFYVVFTGTFQ